MEFQGKLESFVSFYKNNKEEGYQEYWDEADKIITRGGWQFRVNDEWNKEGADFLVKRTIHGKRISNIVTEQGVRFGFYSIIKKKENTKMRFCVPSLIYTEPEKYEKKSRHTFMEDRLTGPVVLAFEKESGEYIWLSKEKPSKYTKAAVRNHGDSRYLQKTENVSMGYTIADAETIFLESCWPYGEEEKSSALSADERPAVAYYPLDGEDFTLEFYYRIGVGQKDSFAEAVYDTYEKLADRLERAGEDPVKLPFSILDAIEYRMKSLGKSFQEFHDNGAGFFFHFDPRYGYGSNPSGFSSSYDTIPHDSYTHILEYGFTGRQLNAAFIMASEKGGKWLERGEKVVDFFLSHCQKENGWIYSLYDLEANAPFYSFGDPEAPRLHYVSKTNKKGNYLRTMTEPMNDLLDCYRWYKSIGREHEHWLEAVLCYADFLVKYQNQDGSWYRGYCPDGEGTDSVDRPEEKGEKAERAQKASTAIPLVFLSELCIFLQKEEKACKQYEKSAQKAGDFVLKTFVSQEHYQGATMDNPNAVDKEAAQYVMAGLLHLYFLTNDERYLDGAENAAFLFTTWNYIWNAPMEEGTVLYKKDFKTMGLGGINSVWGGGVVDIYSLFHIRELYWIGKKKEHPLMCKMAEWAAIASSQILSYPEDHMGFADIGMQPEGFGICPQGMDDGMIQKGGIWGTLGWIYSAGIYGLNNFLKSREEKM